MFTESMQQKLHAFYSATRIPISLIKDSAIVVSYVPIVLPEDPAYLYMKEYLNRITEPVYLLQKDTLCGILPLSEPDVLLLVGPAMLSECTSSKCNHIIESLGLSYTIKRQLLYYLRRVPVLTTSRFRSNMQMLDMLINDSNRLPIAIMDSSLPEEEEKIEDVPLIASHNTYQIEMMISHAIIDGNIEALRQIWAGIGQVNHEMGITADSELDNLRNIYISACAIASRAAIAGNVSYDLALSMCDQYISKAETFTSASEILAQIYTMITEFAQLVHDMQMPQNASSITLAAIREIQSNIFKHTQIKDIAQKLHISTSYLSHTFHKDMSESLKVYMQKEKILTAISLLNGSDLTLAQIADDLGFSSQAHFQSVFRQYTGHTPMEVREHPDLGHLKDPRGWEKNL